MATKPKFKIGLDFHGVITDNPEYFRLFTELARDKGWEIHIITGGPHDVITKFLEAWHITYDKLFTILDYYDAQGKVTFLDDGSFHMDDKLWDSAKAEYCRQHQIDFHIDDSRIYGKYYTTPYCLYNRQAKKCKYETTVVDMAAPPHIALGQIDAFLHKKAPQ